MNQERYAFEDRRGFLDKLVQLRESGTPGEQISVITPYHVHEVEHLLQQKPSRLKFFTLGGALLGMMAGFGLTLFTSLDWPLCTGGKPIVSILPFIIIAFELTILFGAVFSFVGFLWLGGFPSLQGILHPEEHENRFIIVVRQRGGS